MRKSEWQELKTAISKGAQSCCANELLLQRLPSDITKALYEELSDHSFPLSSCRLVNKGQHYRFQTAAGSLSYAKAREDGLLSGCFTFVVDGIHKHTDLLGAIYEDLRAAIPLLGINAYFSTDRASGFGLHHDEHHVVAIQVSGHKRWRICSTSDVIYELYSSDVLSVPKGICHSVIAIENHSFSLSFGFAEPTLSP